MNLIGKIFTVLIFVMSIVFMTMALMVYATHKNWREVVKNPTTGLSKQLDDAKKSNDELSAQKKQLEESLITLKDEKQKALTDLENKISLKAAELTQLQKEQAADKQGLREAVTSNIATQTENKALREKFDDMTKKEEQAQSDRDLHLEEVKKLTDQLHARVIELATLKDRSRTLADDLAKVKKTLMLFGKDPKIDYEDIQPPPMKGFVMSVKNGGVVEISVGGDSGLRKGHKLEVYRVTSNGSTYVGRIEVVETTPDRAICKIDPKLRISDIQNGDRVTTQLDR